jgi:simple sugar transport system ATP-binding protein
LVSHNMPQVIETADRIVIMRLGRTVGHVSAAATTVDELVRAMTTGILQSRAA